MTRNLYAECVDQIDSSEGCRDSNQGRLYILRGQHMSEPGGNRCAILAIGVLNLC